MSYEGFGAARGGAGGGGGGGRMGGGGRGGGGFVSGGRGGGFVGGGRGGFVGGRGMVPSAIRPSPMRPMMPGRARPGVMPGMRTPRAPGVPGAPLVGARAPTTRAMRMGPMLKAPGAAGKLPKAPKPLGAGKKPSPKPHPKHGHKGKPFFHHRRPGFFPWWQPWFPFAGWWPDWGPWWWPSWGIWLTDLIELEGAPYVIVWVDRCSPEYASAVAEGTLEIPEYYEGYPVVVQYTCGQEPEITQAAAGFGVDGRLYQHTATFLQHGKPVQISWFDPQPDPPAKLLSVQGCCGDLGAWPMRTMTYTGKQSCGRGYQPVWDEVAHHFRCIPLSGFGFGAATEPMPTTIPPPPTSPPPIATVMGKDIKVPMMSLGVTALVGGVTGLIFGGVGGALAAAGAGAFGYWMGHQAGVKQTTA